MSNTETPWNWNAVLDELIRDPENEELMVNANNRAQIWADCACAAQDARIPRYAGGEPKDEHLKNLGCEFMDEVGDGEYGSAKCTLSEIESRAAEILADGVEMSEPKLSTWYRRYRIYHDSWSGYEACVWTLWWPFWRQCFGSNTHKTTKDAFQCAKRHKYQKDI